MLPNVPAMLRCALRGADDGRGAQYHQHAARRSYRRLHPRARRGEGADHRPGVRGVVGPALQRLARKPLVIDVDDALTRPVSGWGRSSTRSFSARTPGLRGRRPPTSAPLALNYTSGTTGNPKGVVYHHRGAFLESVGNVAFWPLPPRATYLWTLPMFHCNGWCYTWAVTAMAGTHVCLRRVDPALVFRLIAQHRVTHVRRAYRADHADPGDARAADAVRAGRRAPDPAPHRRPKSSGP